LAAGNWEETFEAIPSQHFFMGGVRINEHFSTSIPGLFAAGEVSGGVHGANRLSGVAFAEIFVVGPIVGSEAAKYSRLISTHDQDENLLQQTIIEIERPLRRYGDGWRPFSIKQRIQRVMSGKLGPVRSGDEMAIAVTELESLQRELPEQMKVNAGVRRYNREMLDALEVPLMLKTALMVARSALTRTESRGSHFRADYPNTDDAWVKNVMVKRDRTGQMQVATIPVILED
jgi:fumarate reductase (CoM/CoB) subunit A